MKTAHKPKQVSRAKRPYKTPSGIVYLTDLQKKYGDAAIKAKSAKELIDATQEIYNTDRNTARTIASENIRKPSLFKYLSSYGQVAELVMVDVMANADYTNKRQAAENILDRLHGKPTQRTENLSAKLITISLGNLKEKKD